MIKRKASFLEKLKKIWLIHFTESGRALFLCFLISLAMGNSNSYADTFFLTCFFAFLALLAILFSLFYIPNAKVYHNLPRRVVAKESIPFTVTVENLSRRYAKDLILQSSDVLPFCSLDPEEQISSEGMPTWTSPRSPS